MKAVDRYNFHRGYRFSTYAGPWIKQAIIRSITNQGKTVRIPAYMVEEITRLHKTKERLTQKLGRPPADPASVWYIVKKYLRQAQIEKDKLSPHTLRHTFATTLLKQGENILTIKELLSHRNLRTTEKYLHINSEDLKAAVNKIDLTTK